MALDSKNNIKSVFIVPDIAATAVATMYPGSSVNNVAICNMSNEVLDATTVLKYSKIKIIKDRGADLPLQQLVLDLSSISAYVGTAGVAAREQVSFIGYSGSGTDTIQVVSNNFYSIKLEHTPNAFAYGKRPANYKYGTFQSPDFGAEPIQNATNALVIANGLVNSLVQNFRPNRTTDWRVKSELVNSAPGFAITGAPTNWSVTRYSKKVTYTGTDPSNAFAAGDYLRIGGTSTSAPVYKMASVDFATNTVILETAYQGDTATIANALMEVVNASSLGLYWGIKITGIKQKYDVNRWRQYDKVRFNVFLDGFPYNTTPTGTITTAALDGTAVYEQVANDEYISWGDEGQVFVDQIPPLFREQDAVVGTQYNPVVLGWLDKLPSLIGAGENKGQAIMYLAGSPILGNQGLELVDVLNAWLTGKFANLPGTLV